MDGHFISENIIGLTYVKFFTAPTFKEIKILDDKQQLNLFLISKILEPIEVLNFILVPGIKILQHL